jgi:quinol monooxygenase YgiN
MINVTATFQVSPDRAPEFEAAVAEARPAMLADAGCLRYDLQRVGRSEVDFVLLEAYESGEALRRHGELQAFRDLGDVIKSMLVAEPAVVILRPIGGQTDLVARPEVD